MPHHPVIIVGAGLAGLCCALRLQERHIPFRILEAADQPGGRIRTDVVDGFLLDRGFQVLLTAYPEAKHVLDFHALDLKRFYSGAIVHAEGGTRKIADPLRNPLSALPSAFSSIGTLADKMNVMALRMHVMRGSLHSVLSNPETSTLENLRNFHFSNDIIDKFFRPFFSGIFLEPELATSSRKFEFIFRMFSEGEAALPAKGMQAIPDQLAARLPEGSIRFETRVESIDGTRVTTAGGETIEASSVVLAVEQPTALKLLGKTAPAHANGTACVYFDAPASPVRGAWLVLNGEGFGPVNNLCVPSEVAPGYAPPGRSLVSVSIVGNPPVGDDVLERLVRNQLDGWFGSTADWKYLRSYRIPYALPSQPNGALSPVAKPVRAADGVYLCGDYMDIASTNGAMLSGRRAADALAG